MRALQKAKSQRGSQRLVRAPHVNCFATSTIGDVEWTMVLIVGGHLYKLSTSPAKFNAVTEQIPQHISSVQRLRRLFEDGCIVPLANIEKVTCLEANCSVTLHYHEDGALRKLTIDEFGTCEFRKVWLAIRGSLRGRVKQLEEKANAVDALVVTPYVLIGAVGAAVACLFSMYWVALGFLSVPGVSTVCRLLSWPVQVTLIVTDYIATDTQASC